MHDIILRIFKRNLAAKQVIRNGVAKTGTSFFLGGFLAVAITSGISNNQMSWFSDNDNDKIILNNKSSSKQKFYRSTANQLNDINHPWVQVYISSNAGDRLTKKVPIAFIKANKFRGRKIGIDNTVKFQKIDGFGASFNEAGMICLNTLEREKADSVLRCLFDTIEGAGFSLMKSPIAACDFSSAGPWYSYNDTPEDTAMTSFSIERDLGPNGMVTYIKRAAQFGHFTVHATMDFPPDWMLYSLKRGEKHIKPQYYSALAKYFALYIQSYKSAGIKIDYLSPFNEPDNGWYTNITYDIIKEIILNYLLPQFKEENIITKIQFGETVSRSEGLKKLPRYLNNSDFLQHISTITVHGYDWDKFDAIYSLHEKYPNIPIWMSEVCYAKESNIPPHGPKTVPVYDFTDGQYWGNMIMNDIKNGASGWIYWNMILDENGGPWLVSLDHGNPENNAQHPVVVVNRKTKEVNYTGLFYYLAHFSRFVRPGAFRINVKGGSDKLNTVAFQNSDGKIAVIVINNNDDAIPIDLCWKNLELNYQLPEQSIATFIWEAF